MDNDLLLSVYFISLLFSTMGWVTFKLTNKLNVLVMQNVLGCLAQSWPYNNLSARDGFCNGVGCCQVALTRNMSYYDVDFSERYKSWISMNGTNRSTTED